jgi:hypothetical protein
MDQRRTHRRGRPGVASIKPVLTVVIPHIYTCALKAKRVARVERIREKRITARYRSTS